MTVYDLIEMLNRVQDKNSIVVFDPKGGFQNEGIEGYDDLKFSVDDALEGCGKLKGTVYLVEDKVKNKYLKEREEGDDETNRIIGKYYGRVFD